jgi:hypothetical protein
MIILVDLFYTLIIWHYISVNGRDLSSNVSNLVKRSFLFRALAIYPLFTEFYIEHSTILSYGFYQKKHTLLIKLSFTDYEIYPSIFEQLSPALPSLTHLTINIYVAFTLKKSGAHELKCNYHYPLNVLDINFQYLTFVFHRLWVYKVWLKIN